MSVCLQKLNEQLTSYVIFLCIFSIKSHKKSSFGASPVFKIPSNLLINCLEKPLVCEARKLQYLRKCLAKFKK